MKKPFKDELGLLIDTAMQPTDDDPGFSDKGYTSLLSPETNVNQASLKAQDPKTRQKLLRLMFLIDNIQDGTKQEKEQVGKLYDALNRNSAFNQELQSMMQSIRYE